MTVRRFFGVLILLVLLPLGVLAQDDDTLTLTYDELERSYQLFVPASYDASTPAPLVVVLHGAGDSASGIRAASSFDDLAEETGTIVAYPNSQNSIWNYLEIPIEDETTVDDTGFVTALVDQLSTDYAVDPANISVIGYSNGGLMALRLRCELGNRLGSAVMVGSSPTFRLVDHCLGTDPVSTMMVLGTADESFPWNGYAEVDAQNRFYSSFGVSQAVPFLSGLNRCDASLSITAEITSQISDTRVLAQIFDTCEANTQFILLGMVDFTHRWPAGIGVQLRTGSEGTLTQAIWEFANTTTRTAGQ
ncbi:MAG: PHB depolymerase family esterase [Aggregatilineales bacterium]